MVEKTPADLNPRSHAVKHVEMAVLRAIQFIDLFDEYTEEEGVRDWRDIVTMYPAGFRKIYGNDHYEIQPRLEIEELWIRFKDGTIYKQVLDLVENVPLDSLAKDRQKEIRRGIDKCRERI